MRKTNKQWSNDFYRAIEDYEYDCDNEGQFLAKLEALGFPQEMAIFILRKMTENRSPLLD